MSIKTSPTCSKCKAEAILFASDPYLGYETDTETEVSETRPHNKYCLPCLQSSIQEHPTLSEIQKKESLLSLTFVTQMLSNCSVREKEESSGEEIIIINNDTSSSSCSCDECRNCHTETSSSSSDTQDDIIMIDSSH